MVDLIDIENRPVTSEFILLDILESLDKNAVIAFCKRRGINDFSKLYFDGEYMGVQGNDVKIIDTVAKALIADIEDRCIKKFHKDTILQIAYWHNQFERKKLPDSFFLALHKIFYPESKMQHPISEAIREFIACWLILAPKKNNGTYNISLAAKALGYIKRSSSEYARRQIQKIMNETEVEDLIEVFSKEDVKYSIDTTMGAAIAKIQAGSRGISHGEIAEKGMKMLPVVSGSISFDELYKIVKNK